MDDFTARSAWLAAQSFTNLAALPFSFTCGGRSLAALAASCKTEVIAVSRANTQRLRLTNPASGLLVQWELTCYPAHPAVEWVVTLENTGTEDTPILENILALDLPLLAASSNTVLHYARGATCSMADFEPLTERMAANTRLRLQGGGGRSSSDFLPFFNWEQPSGGGIVLGLGWSGEWAAEFTQPDPQRTLVRAGLALTHLKLHPGERIRSPRVALLFYRGDWIDGQNSWRRFVLAHHRPTVGGQPFQPPLLLGNWGGLHASNHLANIKAIAAANVPMDYYWIDAEWFGHGPWWQNTGDWRVNPDYYPDGLKPISDLLHQSGRKFLLWFEPERVCTGTPWAVELDRWLLALPRDKRIYRWEKQSFPDWVKAESLRNQIKEDDRLVNLGNPKARQFVTDYISKCITEYGLDCYRHDANIAPLEFWRVADAPDRQGITEIRWVEGLYTFWDELRRRHPQLIIDNCASGGRRIDLETMDRSTPFWRTDFPADPNGKQCHTYGLSFWAPLNATGAVTPGRDSDFAWRSTFSSSVVFGLFINDEVHRVTPPVGGFPLAKAKAALEQYRRLQPCYHGDYYPLTPYTQARDLWMAWQFDRPDLGQGLVQAFRRDRSSYEAARFKLRGVERKAQYRVINLDHPEPREVSGAELLDTGLLVTLPQQPAAAVFVYERK